MRRLSLFPTRWLLIYATESVRTRWSISKFLAELGGNAVAARRCYQPKIKTAKRGFFRLKISGLFQSKLTHKVSSGLNSPLLFKVFLRPSFGACAPPSPNSARNLYFLRRVGRLIMVILSSGNLSRRLAPLSPRGKAFPQSAKTFNDNSGNRRPLSALCATLPEGESVSAECVDFLFFRLGFWIETAKSVPTWLAYS